MSHSIDIQSDELKPIVTLKRLILNMSCVEMELSNNILERYSIVAILSTEKNPKTYVPIGFNIDTKRLF